LILAEQPDPRFPGCRLGVVRCRTCGLVYRNIRQKAENVRGHGERYPDDYLMPDWIAGRKTAFAGPSKLLGSFRRNNRILDVGAGHGFFLDACAGQGWDCHGVEPSRRAADYARRNFGLSLSCGAFEEALYPDEHFDAVTFFNVLESLPDPKAALQKTRRLLRPGGAVMVRFSNAAFHVAAFRFFLLLGRIHPRFNRADQAVIHLYAFDRKTITRLLSETGFADIKVTIATLSWTTTSREGIGAWRKLACGLLYAGARLVTLASFGRLLISPSLLVTARKD
jgi:2-polyprenyl-3-methyl-5-hydroxy-6-metoxy-1,4-benzoquinol methylase